MSEGLNMIYDTLDVFSGKKQFSKGQTNEEGRKNRALEGLAGLITEISGECVTLERENESAKLSINGELLEQFSIWGDSPLAVLFDAMQAVLRHKGRML
jgi:hypothetical protein